MDCRLFGDKPLFKPMLIYCQLDPYEQISKYKYFTHENAYEIIVQGEMS